MKKKKIKPSAFSAAVGRALRRPQNRPHARHTHLYLEKRQNRC